ncbi:L-Ala-D/L-Glu epimerase [Triticum urartu]|uniref:L-Ala-D/L-Glu epimerase n=1 Tax=Triticum urartu TaxID=4572 RepID=M7YCW3_TRIUA|nr:L-Ala-D/L-Glu epimerase [Triticum urartu]
MGVTPVLFEQPVHRDDWEGLHDVSIAAMEKYRVAVAADESCRGLLDAQKIIHGNLAHVINIKPEKLGVLGALEVIDAARKAGIALMIGGMVETRIAMGFAGHLAAGLGCFSFIDLDTPLLLSEDPVYGGYEASGPVYKFKNARGHGGFLHLDNNNGWARRGNSRARTRSSPEPASPSSTLRTGKVTTAGRGRPGRERAHRPEAHPGALNSRSAAEMGVPTNGSPRERSENMMAAGCSICGPLRCGTWRRDPTKPPDAPTAASHQRQGAAASPDSMMIDAKSVLCSYD